MSPKSVLWLRTKVIGCLLPGQLRVNMGYDLGMMDFGHEIEIPIESVPPNLRLPNSEFWLRFDDEEVIHIKPIE